VRRVNTVSVASTIAIDGPAGAGKTVVGRAVAERLGYLFLDTGAMYRAVAYLALKRVIPVDDEAGMIALAGATDVDIRPGGPADGRPYTVLAGGEDVTWQIRTPEVDATVSPVSAIAGVRRAMVLLQARIAGRGRCVLVGRDIGTVVLPNADLKVYLTASLEARARRRLQEVRARGQHADEAEVRAGIVQRDELDSGRSASPLRVADGAHSLDTTKLNVDQVVERIIALAEGKAR